MTTVLATYNIKGGVGKTSAAVNLAYLAARENAHVLLWDLDPQGASTYLFRVKPKVKGGGRKLVRGKSEVEGLIKGTDHDRLDLLPADFSYRHMDLALDATKKPHAAAVEGARPDRRRLRLRLPRLPAEHLARVRERVRGGRRPARAADPGHAVVAHLRAAQRVLPDDGPQVLAFFSMFDRRKRLHREVMDALWEKHTACCEARSPRPPTSSGWARSATRWRSSLRAAGRRAPTRSSGARCARSSS